MFLFSNSHLLHAHLLCGAIRERLERYLKLSSLIISRIPQDTLCDVTEEGLSGEGGKEEEDGWGVGGGGAMSHISQVLSKGSGGTPSDTDGRRKKTRNQTIPGFLNDCGKISGILSVS